MGVEGTVTPHPLLTSASHSFLAFKHYLYFLGFQSETTVRVRATSTHEIKQVRLSSSLLQGLRNSELISKPLVPHVAVPLVCHINPSSSV